MEGLQCIDVNGSNLCTGFQGRGTLPFLPSHACLDTSRMTSLLALLHHPARWRRTNTDICLKLDDHYVHVTAGSRINRFITAILAILSLDGLKFQRCQEHGGRTTNGVLCLYHRCAWVCSQHFQ